MKQFPLGVTAFAVALLFCAESWAMSAPEFYLLAQQQRGINAFAVTCQSAHETGYWTSPLWRIANNGAGLKAPPAWRKSKPFVAIKSPESNGTTYYQKKSYFRKYGTAEEFLSDYAQKIKADYPRCETDNLWGYFAGLYKGRMGKWATDHRYFELLTVKAIQLAPALLGGADRLQTAYELAVKRGSLESWQIKIIKTAMKGCVVNVE